MAVIPQIASLHLPQKYCAKADASIFRISDEDHEAAGENENQPPAALEATHLADKPCISPHVYETMGLLKGSRNARVMGHQSREIAVEARH
ncbi:hypothetical protein NC652_018568 [Populus alba x Populus x berolinensis]|nr:hypothetical protein NC652_018568 [Populus alba x Populus x berolinensis]